MKLLLWRAPLGVAADGGPGPGCLEGAQTEALDRSARGIVDDEELRGRDASHHHFEILRSWLEQDRPVVLAAPARVAVELGTQGIRLRLREIHHEATVCIALGSSTGTTRS